MKRTTTFALISSVLLGSAALAQTPAADSAALEPPGPLFDSHDIVEVTIAAPLSTIIKDRDDESEEHSGAVVIGGDTLPVEIRTRGRFRLQKRTCNFPPLRLDFPKDSVVGSLFENQNKLKLVTHCNDDRSDYEQYVLKEYLVYRAYNTLVDESFRVRLFRIRYEDTDGKREPLTRYGFVIEDEDRLAQRLGGRMVETPVVLPDQMDGYQLALLEVFQFMIGNTDWSAFDAPGAERCCHNVRPVAPPIGVAIPIPYDFDFSGAVDARYAKPAAGMDIRNVRERKYRGICWSQQHLPQVFQHFNERRDAIYALYNSQEGLEPDVLKKSVEYLDDFYKIINDARKSEYEIVRSCRRLQ